MPSKFKTFFRRKTNVSISAICASTIICKDYIEFFKLWGWDKEPNLSYLPTLAYRYPEDLNDRELRDAETLMSLCCNTVNAAALEIGTSTGLTTLGMALNAPDATIYTVDIPRSEAVSGKGGKLITHILEPESVGYHYRQAQVANVQQIFANTITWEPDLPPLDLAFIDGCHDREVVYQDTLKVLPFIKPGGFIAWHDANPLLKAVFSWIGEVCAALNDLIQDGVLSGRLFCVRDSWTTIWRKPLN